MAVDGDEVDDDDDRDMLLLSLLLCWNASLQRGPCDLPLVWVHVRVVESLWLQWPVAAGCGKPVAARYSSCSVVCHRLWSTDAAFLFKDFSFTSRPATPHGLAYARNGF